MRYSRRYNNKFRPRATWYRKFGQWVAARWEDETIQEVLFGAAFGVVLAWIFFSGV